MQRVPAWLKSGLGARPDFLGGCPDAGEQRHKWAFDTAYDTVLATTARRDRHDTAIAEMAAESEFTPVVVRLGCLQRGRDRRLTALVRRGQGNLIWVRRATSTQAQAVAATYAVTTGTTFKGLLAVPTRTVHLGEVRSKAEPPCGAHMTAEFPQE